ncbi:hypothetical protein LIER_43588 [Lithospermum erythrorhizon]|uniref:Uncharacterized protein n=1 Tax=Lithospermum erythrorhizon TaxID=34254 RepID=A0AAV3QD52_LITER
MIVQKRIFGIGWDRSIDHWHEASPDYNVDQDRIFPKYMAQLFSRPSGTMLFKTHNYINMEMPLNIANYLDEMKQIVIRNGKEGVEAVFSWSKEYHRII